MRFLDKPNSDLSLKLPKKSGQIDAPRISSTGQFFFAESAKLAFCLSTDDVHGASVIIISLVNLYRMFVLKEPVIELLTGHKADDGEDPIAKEGGGLQ